MFSSSKAVFTIVALLSIVVAMISAFVSNSDDRKLDTSSRRSE